VPIKQLYNTWFYRIRELRRHQSHDYRTPALTCVTAPAVLLCYAFCQGLGRRTPFEDGLLEVGSGKHSEGCQLL
jgi:hypothetical protein